MRSGSHDHQEQLQSELPVLQVQGKQGEDSELKGRFPNKRQTRQCGLGLSSDAGAMFPLSYMREARVEGEESFWGSAGPLPHPQSLPTLLW